MSILEIYTIGLFATFLIMLLPVIFVKNSYDGLEIFGLLLAAFAAIVWPWVVLNAIWEVLKRIYFYLEMMWFKHKDKRKQKEESNEQ